MLVLRHISVFALSVGLLTVPAQAQQTAPAPTHPPSDKPTAPAKPEAAPTKPAPPSATGAAGSTTSGSPAAKASPDAKPAASAATAPAGTPAAPSTGALPPASTAAQPGATEASKSSGPPPSPAEVKKARELWYRGVDAFRNGRYEEARQAFSECYALMPKSDVLRNLSISEIQSGHYVAAARHLTTLLSGSDLPPNVREEATKRLAQAEAQVGKLNITVDVPGATVNIDGAPIGRTPLDGSWYIEPGQHEVNVSKQDYPAETRQIYALAGVAIPINVSLESLRREQERDAHAAELMGTSEGETPRDRGIGTAATATLITTGALTAAGLIAGIAFTVSADHHDDNADQHGDHLGGGSPCGKDTLLVNDCQNFWKEQSDAHNDRQRAAVSFIGAGVAGAFTLGYGLYLLLDDDKEPAKPKASRSLESLQPGVALSSRGASLSLQGQF